MRQALLGCLALLVGMVGCALIATAARADGAPALQWGGGRAPQIPPTGHTLGPGDVLRVSVYDNPDLSQEVTIGADGAFSYPLIGRVQAAGLPVQQLEGLLAKRFAEGYLVSPQVGVTVTQHKSQQVYVMGAVKAPGSYPLQRQTTFLEMLSAAGGPTPEAGSEVILTRAADKQALPSSTAQSLCCCRTGSRYAGVARTIDGRGVPQRIISAGWRRDLCAAQRHLSMSQVRSSALVGIVWSGIPPSRRPSHSLAGLPNLLPPRV